MHDQDFEAVPEADRPRRAAVFWALKVAAVVLVGAFALTRQLAGGPVAEERGGTTRIAARLSGPGIAEPETTGALGTPRRDANAVRLDPCTASALRGTRSSP